MTAGLLPVVGMSGSDPFKICFVLSVAKITNEKRLFTFSKQSSTVTRAIGPPNSIKIMFIKRELEKQPLALLLRFENCYAIFQLIMKKGILLLGILSISGCSYHFATVKEFLPGGIKSVSIPTFQNRTKESGIENTFTSALRNEFIKSKAIQVVDRDQAQGEIIGKVMQLSLEATSHEEKNLEARGTKILAREYSANVTVEISLIRKKDQKVIWNRTLSDSRRYSSAEDLLVNEAKQREAFDKIAVYLMEQAHDQMFEDF